MDQFLLKFVSTNLPAASFSERLLFMLKASETVVLFLKRLFLKGQIGMGIH